MGGAPKNTLLLVVATAITGMVVLSSHRYSYAEARGCRMVAAERCTRLTRGMACSAGKGPTSHGGTGVGDSRSALFTLLRVQAFYFLRT